MNDIWRELDAIPMGNKRQWMFGATDSSAGLPLSYLSGREAGPTVLAVSGVHGGEYAGILTLIELARELAPERLRGRLIMIHPVNLPGCQERRATVLPTDGLNINGLFPGDLRGGPAARIAGLVAELQSRADFYLDLHTADLFETTSPLACYPATGDEAVTRASRAAALAAGVPHIIKSTLAGAGITEAARRGRPALLLKRGGLGGTCRRSEVGLYKKDVVNVLKHLGLLDGEPEKPAAPPREITPHYLRGDQAGLWLPTVECGQAVQAGQSLGRLTDFFGRLLADFSAEKDGVVLYGLQALSANPGDILLVY